MQRVLAKQRELTSHFDFPTIQDEIPINLEPGMISMMSASERNRIYTMISDQNGIISDAHLKTMGPYLETLPPPPTRRIANEPIKGSVPRSHFLDQFYSHSMSGIEGGEHWHNFRKFVAEQKRLKEVAQQSTELLKLAMEKLTEAFPEVARCGVGVKPRDDPILDEASRGPKCPTKLMEGSIAAVLEQTEHLTMNLTRENVPN